MREKKRLITILNVNNVWVEDESVDKSMFVNDNDILCDIHTSYKH